MDRKHPKAHTLSAPERRELLEREQSICTFVCDSTQRTFCGYDRHPGYRHRPMTRYQAMARRRPAIYLQQYTKCLKPIKVERWVSSSFLYEARLTTCSASSRSLWRQMPITEVQSHYLTCLDDVKYHKPRPRAAPTGMAISKSHILDCTKQLPQRFVPNSDIIYFRHT